VIFLVQKFQVTGSVHDGQRTGRFKTGRSDENIAAVAQSVAEELSTSIFRCSQELGLHKSTVWRILHKDLHLRSYKIQLTQELKPRDHFQRRNFVNWFFEQEAGFSRSIIFSDILHFSLDGCVNKKNCRILGEESPRVTVEKSLHPQKCKVLCGF